MNNKTCFFIGHRRIPDNIKEQLTNIIVKHVIEYNVTCFTVGHYGSFDSLVQNVLGEIKQLYPNIKLYLLTPYYYPHNSYIKLPKNFDGTLYPEGMEKVPKPYAIVEANRYMIKRSNYLISYCRHIGNTRNFVEYAQKREKKKLIKITLL